MRSILMPAKSLSCNFKLFPPSRLWVCGTSASFARSKRLRVKSIAYLECGPCSLEPTSLFPCALVQAARALQEPSEQA